MGEILTSVDKENATPSVEESQEPDMRVADLLEETVEDSGVMETPNKSPKIIADDSCKIWVQKIINTTKKESEDSNRIVKMADVTDDLDKETGEDSGFQEEVNNSVKETEDFVNVNSVDTEEDPHVDS